MKNVKLMFSAFLMGSLLLFGACMKKYETPTSEDILEQEFDAVDKTQLSKDISIIKDSLAKWGISALSEPHGVFYTIDTVGNGPTPSLESFITVRYEGILLNKGFKGPSFTSNPNLQYYLSGLILGWKTSLTYIPEGSTATLFIPSGLAYGPIDRRDDMGNIVIPANSNLIFKIKLIDVL